MKALGSEDVALAAALGRTAARDVASPADVPPFARSAVDGFALRAADTFGAGPFDPRELKVTFEVLPGRLSDRTVGPGEAARITTGAPVPAGADAVCMLEHVEERAGTIRLIAPLAPRKNVVPRGEDVARGDVVVARGRRLRPEDLGVLASIRQTTVHVHRQPRVVVFSSGNEVRDPLEPGPLPEGAILDANGAVLEALATHEGALVRRGGILRDDRDTIRAALERADADVTVTSGAASKGQEDFMPGLVRELGQLWVQGVSIRPGHPVGFGCVGERLHFMLPGNPVAAYVCFRAFVRPALGLLCGLTPELAFRPERTTRARLARKLPSVVGRTDFVRVRFTPSGEVEPVSGGGAGALSTVTRADGIVVVARELEGLEAGVDVEVELL